MTDTPSSLSTPPTRSKRRKAVNSPALSVSFALLRENDDAEEKRLRRKSKLLTNNILSPGGIQSSPGRISTAEKDK